MPGSLLGSTSRSGSQQTEEMCSSRGFYLYIVTTFNKIHSRCQARGLQLCFKVATYYFKIGKSIYQIVTKKVILSVGVFWNNYVNNYLVFSLKVSFRLTLNCSHNQVLSVQRLTIQDSERTFWTPRLSSLLKTSAVFQTPVVSDQTVLPYQGDEVFSLWLQHVDPVLLPGRPQDNSF